MRRAVAVPVALLLVLAFAGPARADGSGDLPPPPPPPSSPPPSSPPPSQAPAPSSAPRQGSWGDVGFFLQKTAGGTFIALSPITGTRLQLVGPVWAEGLWGLTLALGIGSNGAQQDMAIGNPYVGLDYVAHTPGMTLVAGGGLTLPLAQGGPPITYAVSEGMRARWDPWIWAQQRMALVAKARVRFQRPGGLTFAGEAGLGYLFWLGAGSAPGLVDLQLAGEVGYRPTPLFSFGLRMTAVAGQPIGSNDLLQLGLEPYLRIHGGGQMYEIRLTLPLDGPYGFGFAPGGVWGIEVGGGIAY